LSSLSRVANPVAAASASWRTAACAVLASVALLAGCAHKPAKPLTATSLFEAAHKSMVIGDFKFAVKEYEALTARFPFSSQSRQARLDLIYCYYREGEKDTAIDAADEFLRENPTHPRVDYAWYMKGLVYFERQPWKIERWLGVDMARKPPSDALKSINAFNTVVTQYPKSIYAHDALRRLIYLRNRLAQYELNVARYYVKRGAYIAAARRAAGVIEQYDGAPSEPQAVAVMLDSYRRLGYTQLVANVERVYQLNYPPTARLASTASPRHWWEFWRRSAPAAAPKPPQIAGTEPAGS
jgi:outer membrane protein assembly factor BamD